ncbi:MAG: hypothetical protein R6V04_05985 [bacterium]
MADRRRVRLGSKLVHHSDFDCNFVFNVSVVKEEEGYSLGEVLMGLERQSHCGTDNCKSVS